MRFLHLFIGMCAGLGLVGCQQQEQYPNRPITLVCPWAAGGGTDRVSRQMAAYLERELQVPVNVINATGGKGVTGHSRGLLARGDGYTLTMATLELNMMHWSGLTHLSYDDCIPIMSVNEDYAALFVAADAPWETLADLESAIRSDPGSLKGSGTASGGAWHLALAGWLMQQSLPVDAVTWISSTGAGPSLQELMSGGLDMVCCSLPEAKHLLQAGEVRCLGVMAPKRAFGFDDVPTFAEFGSDWTLGGWRGVAVPRDTPPEIVDRLVAAVDRVVSGKVTIEVRETTSDGQGTVRQQTFPQFMASESFDPTARGPDEFKSFLIDSDQKFGELLTHEAMQAVNSDRYHPLIFPGVIGLLAGIVGGVLVWQRTSANPLHPESRETAPTHVGRWNFLLVIASIVFYVVVVEQVGFIITAGVILLVMLWRFRARPLVAIACAIVLSPLLFYGFAHLLRVPLPHGWLGW